MSDEDLRDLERAAANGTIADVERYLGAKIRRSPDLIPRLVRHAIRLERIVVKARLNEDDYYAEITMQQFIDFIERELPGRPRHAGSLAVEGEWPTEEDERRGAPRGGRVTLTGGRSGPVPGENGPGIHASADQSIVGADAPRLVLTPALVQELETTIANLEARVEELERRLTVRPS